MPSGCGSPWFDKIIAEYLLNRKYPLNQTSYQIRLYRIHLKITNLKYKNLPCFSNKILTFYIELKYYFRFR
jgi:hypothetical protein